MIVILINRGLKEYGGDLAIGAYGIVNRMASLFVMVVMGLNQGMQPIAGYNFGAGHYDRVLEATHLTMKLAVGVSAIGFLLCEFFPTAIARIFTSDEELTAIAVYGLRVTFVIFPVVGFQMVATNFFLAIGMPKKSIFLSLTRQLIFLIPFLIVFPYFMGATGVWVSMPTADFIATVVAWAVLKKQFNKLKGLGS